MIKYILKRLVLMIPIMLAVSFIVFFIIDLAPGDEVDAKYGTDLTVEEKNVIREQLGLNDPVITRYFRYMGKLVRGDLGLSSTTQKPVWDEYMQRFPSTFGLAIAAIVVATLIAIPLGILAAQNQNTWIDATCTMLGLLGMSMPAFWLGLLLIIVFSLWLGVLPSFGNDGFLSIILPSITVGTNQAALILRTTRSSMLEVTRQDYLRTARAKGVSERNVIWRHALKNASIPIITVIGTSIGTSLGGQILTETVFAWPGVGRMIVDSVAQRDVNTTTGAIILTTLFASLVILVVDIIYAFVDPRIKARYTK